MSINKMSLYQALEQKKILEDRVLKLKSYKLCCIRKANEDVDVNGVDLKKIMEENIKPGYDQSVALLKNLIALKAAINEANARITIEICGKKMTIADAIIRQRNVDRLIDLYRRMVGNYQTVQDEVNRMNTRLQSNDAINAYLEKALGDGKRNPDDVEKMTKGYLERNTYAVYDPLGTEELARKEIEELEQFKKDLHYKLTQANIENEIEVEFED